MASESEPLHRVALTLKGVLVGACATFDQGLSADVRIAFDDVMTTGGDGSFFRLLRVLLNAPDPLPDEVETALVKFCRAEMRGICNLANDDGIINGPNPKA